MKNYVLITLMLVCSSHGMQVTLNQKSDQLIQAIRASDFNKVKTLIENDQEFINGFVRKFANYGGYAIKSIEAHKNIPGLAATSLAIAEYLQKIGAPIDTQKIETLKKQIQIPAAASVLTPVSKPAPAVPKPMAKPAPVSVPVSSIQPAPAPVAKPAAPSKAAAHYDELMKVVQAHNYQDIEEYLNTHSISNLNPSQLSTIISNPISSLARFDGSYGAQFLQNIRRIVKLLLKNGFKPFTGDLMSYERSRTGDFGPRAGSIQTPLILAIKAGNLPEIKRLIENENYDPNETDTTHISPLGVVVSIELGLFPSIPKLKNAKEIAQYLASRGGRLYENEQRYKAKLKEWEIPGY